MMKKKDIKWAFTYWCERYLKHHRELGQGNPLTAHARGNAYAYSRVLNPDRSKKRCKRKVHFGIGVRFKNTWIGKLLGLKDK